MAALGILNLAMFLAAPARAADDAPKPPRYIIGLSPYLDTAVKDSVYRRVISLLLEHVPLGSSLVICDAHELRTITQADVPEVSAFQSAKTRANQFKDQIQSLKKFLAADPPKLESAKLPAGAMAQAIRFPQFMDFVGENLAAADRASVVIVLGSPLYVDQKEPGFSMIEGYFPSDGHLLADRDGSVFGLKARSGALKGVTAHFGYFGDPWVTEAHQEKVARFWTLYLAEQGGVLGAFTGDLATVFNAARGDAAAYATRAERFQLDRSSTKIEMLRVSRDIASMDWITRDNLPHAAQTPPSKTTGPMKIGIRWRGNLDLDLYATPKPGAETLFFEHMRSAEGYYFKDHRSSPEREYEFIEFESPVDVWRVEARVNFYEGESESGPSGDIRVEFDGRIYEGRFALSAERGNEGRTGPSQRSHWTRINIPEILKLEDKPVSLRP